MGGIGSGRLGTRAIVERCFGLPVEVVTHEQPVQLEVTSRRAPRRTFRLRIEGTNVFVEAPFEQQLRLVKSCVHNGGYRWFWRCPFCRSKIATVYLNPETAGSFGCRECSNLTYRSCNLSGSTSPRRAAREIERLSEKAAGLEVEIARAQRAPKKDRLGRELLALRGELDHKWAVWRERTEDFLSKVAKRYPALRAQLESPGVNKPLMEATDEELRRAFGIHG